MTHGKHARHELRLSLLLLAGVVTFALIGLATDGNWPKVLRVAAAFCAYAGVLAMLVRRRAAHVQTEIPFAWFAAAGAAAGVMSGVVRPEFRLDVLLAGTVAAACLLAGIHCLALRMWRRLLPARVADAGQAV